jgi:hypothetical protein
VFGVVQVLQHHHGLRERLHVRERLVCSVVDDGLESVGERTVDAVSVAVGLPARERRVVLLKTARLDDARFGDLGVVRGRREHQQFVSPDVDANGCPGAG